MNEALVRYYAYQLRVDSIRATTAAGSGHPTSCLSAADILATLFFNTMHYNPLDHEHNNNDRFILSKGHAAPVLYAAYKHMGIISDQELMTLRQCGSSLEGHPTYRFMYNEAATGSLGCGLSIGLGMALAGNLDAHSYYTYVLMGDSEISEGAIWEAAELASYYKADKLIGIVDCNRLGQTSQTMDGHNTQKIAEKFKAFGWDVYEVDGHNVKILAQTFQKAQATPIPSVVIAKTFKGYGIEGIEDTNGYHGKAFKVEELTDALQNLKQRFKKDVTYSGESWKPYQHMQKSTSIACLPSHIPLQQDLQAQATRQAYGHALAAAGRLCNSLVSLDAEVNNSTYAHVFAKEFPERFIQCFIAEQNMVGMAVGLAARGKIPFVSTFSAFFTRAFDQIRMAALGKSPLRLVGSHCGVSIGQDGPSQMGLEDIAMIRAIAGSVVLYPCDAISTYKLVECMAQYTNGISYLRTTREITPLLYQQDTSFTIGGSHVVHYHEQADITIVAAGITVHEALKAVKLLGKENIKAIVIDAYSIKPLDAETIKAMAYKTDKKIVVVEDHYVQGGLGEAVMAACADDTMHIAHCAVKILPFSGQPEELRALVGIDAQGITTMILSLLQKGSA